MVQLENGRQYKNGFMRLLYLEKVKGYYVFYRMNDNSYILTSFISKQENDEIGWGNGNYLADLTSVMNFLDKN